MVPGIQQAASAPVTRILVSPCFLAQDPILVMASSVTPCVDSSSHERWNMCVNSCMLVHQSNNEFSFVGTSLVGDMVGLVDT